MFHWFNHDSMSEKKRCWNHGLPASVPLYSCSKSRRDFSTKISWSSLLLDLDVFGSSIQAASLQAERKKSKVSLTQKYMRIMYKVFN